MPLGAVDHAAGEAAAVEGASAVSRARLVAEYKPVPRELVDTGQMGTLYLIHFERPLAHARHYLGWTQDLDKRLDAHRAGWGGKLMRAVGVAGIPWSVVWTGPGDRNRERLIKNRGSLVRCCPTCKESS